jgi:hypothetical protein
MAHLFLFCSPSPGESDVPEFGNIAADNSGVTGFCILKKICEILEQINSGQTSGQNRWLSQSCPA